MTRVGICWIHGPGWVLYQDLHLRMGVGMNRWCLESALSFGRKVLSRSKVGVGCALPAQYLQLSILGRPPGCLLHITGGPHLVLTNSAALPRALLESVPHRHSLSCPAEPGLRQFPGSLGALKLQLLPSHYSGTFCLE